MYDWKNSLPWLTSDVKAAMTTQMRLDTFAAQLMFAPRLTGATLHSLPLGRPAEVIHLDRLPGAPKDWVRGRGSYVVPVETDIGMWFDWRTQGNDLNTAVLPSVKGMNPLTGQKIEALRLEGYTEKCPVHGEPFKGGGRLCEKCGWEWPPQNYVTSDSVLWCDGFRIDGSVRQFFFSEDDKRDIASLVIGKESVVPAFGFAFWRPKVPRVLPETQTRHVFWESFSSPINTDSCTWCDYSITWADHTSSTSHFFGSDTDNAVRCGNSSNGYQDVTSVHFCATPQAAAGAINLVRPIPTPTCTSTPASRKCVKERDVNLAARQALYQKMPKSHPRDVSIGAGAAIDQTLVQDSLGVEGWQEEPAAIMRLYFCFKEQFLDIVSDGGIAEFEGEKEGYLKNLPIG